MNEKTNAAFETFRKMLIKDAAPTCVRVTIIVTSEGFSIDEDHREPEALRRDLITMRNIRGEFIR